MGFHVFISLKTVLCVCLSWKIVIRRHTCDSQLVSQI